MARTSQREKLLGFRALAFIAKNGTINASAILRSHNLLAGLKSTLITRDLHTKRNSIAIDGILVLYKTRPFGVEFALVDLR